jgi:hypothetical protein
METTRCAPDIDAMACAPVACFGMHDSDASPPYWGCDPK